MLELDIKVDKSQPASSQVVEHIKRKIRRQELRPGDRLPTICELVTKTGVGNYSIRKAISELNHEGVLSASPGKGVYVSQSYLSKQSKQKMQNFAVFSAFRLTSVGPKIAHPQTVAGIFDAGEKFKCKINLVAPNLDISSFNDVYYEIKEASYDGIVWLYPNPSELGVIERLSGKGIDLVVTSHSRIGWKYPCVESDEGWAGLLMGKHFAERVQKLYVFWEPDSGDISDLSVSTAGNLTFLQSLRRSFIGDDFKKTDAFEVLACKERGNGFREKFFETLENAEPGSGVVFANGEAFREVLSVDYKRIVTILRNHEVVIGTSRFENNNLCRLAEDVDFYTSVNPLQDIGKLAIQKMVNIKKDFFEDTTTLLKVEFKPFGVV